MAGLETARGRARDAARWLGVFQARGTRAPAISLLPDATRDLLSPTADPQRLARVCQRATELIDRQVRAERRAAIPSAGARSDVIEQYGPGSAERHAAFATLRQQLAEIVVAIGEDGSPG